MARMGDSVISFIFTTTQSEKVNCGSLTLPGGRASPRCIAYSIFCASGPGHVPSGNVFCVILNQWRHSCDRGRGEMRLQVPLLCSGFCVLYCRMAVARRTMFQRGDVQNKPSGLWGMLKSVTASAPGSESILCFLDSSSPLCTRAE